MEIVDQVGRALELLDPMIRLLLAIGFFGFLLERGWSWVRRPRLSICFDPDEAPGNLSRHAFPSHESFPTMAKKFEAVVTNEGRTTARSVEATAERLEWWDGDEWRDIGSRLWPKLLVWSGTDQTRMHIPPDGRGRRVAVFVIAPVHHPDKRPLLHLAVPPKVADPSSAAGLGANTTRVRLEVTSEGGATASCEMVVDWDPSEEELTAEGDCVGSPC